MFVNCRKCRREIPEGSAYCNFCGAKQTVSKRKPRARGNGAGSAIRRGKSWTAVWTEARYLGDDDKVHYKRRWKGGFASKTEALAFAANPTPDAEKTPTLRHYYKVWERDDLPKLGVSKQTAYKIAWNKLTPVIDRPIDQLDVVTLRDLVAEKAPTYYPARDMRTLLSDLYKLAIAEEKVRVNMAEYITLPTLEEKEMNPFTDQELRALWDHYGRGDVMVGYILLMIYTGMMPGELMQLEQDMIDWDKREIIGCGMKTKKRKATPIVFPELIAPVLDLLCQRSASRIGRVLGMNKDRFYQEYYAALERCGVRRLQPYSCRHTTATALALGNIAPSMIQEVMRHTKFTTTQRYIHPDTAASHTAVNTMTKGAAAPQATNGPERPQAGDYC